ncbi:MAG: hypothetical protein ACP5SI_04110 [Chloroflexia bacterium]
MTLFEQAVTVLKTFALGKSLSIAALLGCFAAVLAACVTPSQPRIFEHEAFVFTIPAGWQTMEELSQRPSAPGQEYYGLGVQEIVMIQSPASPGKGKAFFAVAFAPLDDGENLEARFRKAYENAVPELRDLSEQRFQRGTLSGYEVTYLRRPTRAARPSYEMWHAVRVRSHLPAPLGGTMVAIPGYLAGEGRNGLSAFFPHFP